VTDGGAASYDEPARSYVGLWILATLFGAGFALDAVLGGAVAHLPGWLIAFALVGGAYFLVVYAARSEKSLHLTADALRVGDDVLARTELVAVTTGADDPDLPVLGWPGGMPRGVHPVTVRLADGRDVAVPTRFPDRLVAALGLGTVTSVHEQDVRVAARSEFELLVEVDERAEALFRSAGYALPPVPFDEDELAQAAAVFVAGRPPVGFVQIQEVDGLAHIAEIAVIPRWMRQGIGTALLERACEWARRHGYPAITLTTYADVPWNGPYYARRGFAELTDLTPGLAALRAREASLGLDEVGARVAMRRDLR
jgi:GNAT superfamily N-acetyltransferase